MKVFEKREIQNASFSRILKGFEKMGFIKRKFDKNGRPRYEIVDPIVKRTVGNL